MKTKIKYLIIAIILIIPIKILCTPAGISFYNKTIFEDASNAIYKTNIYKNKLLRKAIGEVWIDKKSKLKFFNKTDTGYILLFNDINIPIKILSPISTSNYDNAYSYPILEKNDTYLLIIYNVDKNKKAWLYYNKETMRVVNFDTTLLQNKDESYTNYIHFLFSADSKIIFFEQPNLNSKSQKFKLQNLRNLPAYEFIYNDIKNGFIYIIPQKYRVDGTDVNQIGGWIKIRNKKNDLNMWFFNVCND